MEHSIASSQGSVSPGRGLLGNWKSIFSGPWSALTAKRSKFTSSTRESGYPLESDISAVLDIDKISARLAIENRAKSDGRNNQPPSTEEGVSGTQREIVVYFKELQRKAQHQIADMARKLREHGEEIDLLGVNGSLRDIPSRCENKILRLIAESQSQLNYLGERGTQQQQHYKDVSEKKQVDQDPEQPDSPVFHWIFMAVLISAGTIAISKISVPGFGSEEIVPPLWAFSTSLIVVLVSSLIARAISRSANHVGQLTRWLSSAVGIGCIGVTASFAAHYIVTVTANADVTLRNVVDSILADPITIVTNVADWKVFGIVISAGLMAYLVNYKPESSHPGHGNVNGVIYRSRRKRDRLTKRLRMQINAIIDEAEVEATELPKRLKAKITQYSRLVDESKRIPASLSDYDVALEDGCNILLDRYRAANTNARQTEVPMSFSEHICFRPEREPNSSMFAEEEGRLEELDQGIADLESEAVQVRQKLRDLNSEAISALENTPAPV